ncbi:MAG: hypothetical protein LBC48_02345 [Dysgonamonadaceae bacterium]|nr:hypothetical protein [Dysgonamonadaceae bacterium]
MLRVYIQGRVVSKKLIIKQ